jgi:mRNA interferase MazF
MKNYTNWHICKTLLESENFEVRKKPKFSERDIWWCSFGENVGYEQDGKHENFERPVLVLKKFSQDMLLGAPLTTSEKDHPLRVPYTIGEIVGSVNLTQIRTLSVKRLHRRMWKMSEWPFEEILDVFSQYISPEKAKTPNKSGQSRTPNGEK